MGAFPLEGGAPQNVTIPTPWGTAQATVGRLHGRDVVFLARHGAGHRIPPHRIAHRANVAALASLGVRAALATAATGGLRADLSPGSLLLLDDLIDFTRGRETLTFFERQVVHTDLSQPYSPALRQTLREAAEALGIPLVPRGTYLCADGPRYETPAEVRLFAAWGGDVVGMTGAPEAVLCREAGIHYAAVALVTNPGAGLMDAPVRHEDVEATMAEAGPRLRALLGAAVARLDPDALPVLGPDASIWDEAPPA